MRIAPSTLARYARYVHPPVSLPVMPGAQGRSRGFVQSVQRGLDTVASFTADAPYQTVSEVAVKLSVNRATTRRFLLTLVTLGYIATDGRQFWLTPKVLELGHAYLAALGLPAVAEPHLRRLVDEVDETAEMAILDGHDIVYIARVQSRTIVTVTADIGTRVPAHATSIGKALLAHLPAEELDRYLEHVELKTFLPRTIVSREALRAELVATLEQGYATADEELEVGLVAISVPIRERSGSVCASINVSTHRARRSLQSLCEDLLPILMRTAREVERDLVMLTPRRAFTARSGAAR